MRPLVTGSCALRVADVMTADTRTVFPHTTVVEAMAAFVENDLRHLLVVDTDGSFSGILSDRDVLRHIACGSAEDATTVAAILRGTPVTVTEETLVVEAIDILRVWRFHALPVVDDRGRLQGILTTTDLLGALHDVLLERSSPGRQARPGKSSRPPGPSSPSASARTW